MGNGLINELKYNTDNFSNLDLGDAIAVFKGNVYPLYLNDDSEENINYLLRFVKTMLKYFPNMTDIFFEENGELRDYLVSNKRRILDAVHNFEELPKMVWGNIDEVEDGLGVIFDNNINYDLVNSPEFKQLLNTGILNNFNYFIINNKIYNTNKYNLDTTVDNGKNLSKILYHGTCSAYLFDILTKGLREVSDNSTFQLHNKGFVFMTSVFDTADRFAYMYANKTKTFEAVIQIDTTKIDSNKIVLDYDFAKSFADDIEKSPFDTIKGINDKYYKGGAAKFSDRNGSKYNRLGYKGIIMPNAIMGVHIKEKGGQYQYYTKEEYMNNINKNENVIHEYVSRHYKEQQNYTVRLYHNTDNYGLHSMLFDGYMDRKAYHKGECKADIIWFTTGSDFRNSCTISIDVNSNDFNTGKFKWMNDAHVICEENINIDEYNFRIDRFEHINMDEIASRHNMNNIDGFGDFIENLTNITNNGNDITEAFVKQIGKQYNCMNVARQWLGDDEYDNMNETVINEVETSDISLKSFEINDELNPKFWVNDKLNSRVRLRLLDIADDFIDEVAVSWVKPEDIVLTGSIANYNWSKYSDIDLHILMDYKKIYKKTEFVEDYFNCKKEIWSDTHPQLKIYGFPVEIYVEDINNKNTSTGIYSLNKNEWIVEPGDFQDAKLNEKYIKNYSAKIMTEIDNLIKRLEKEKDNHKIEILSKKIKTIFDKLKNLRKESLSKSGEMGSGNIIWKICRRMGYLDKIWKYINLSYDKVNSIH